MRRGLSLLLAAFGLGLMLGASQEAEAKKGKTFLYIHENGASPAIRAYEVSKAGDLTELSGSPFAVPGDGLTCSAACGSVAYAHGRKLLFVGTGSVVSAFSVAKDGALTLVGNGGAVPSDPIGLTTIKRGKRTFVYATEFWEDRVRGFEVLAGGSLVEVPGTPTATDNQPIGIATAGKRIVVANSALSLSVFDVAANGALTEVPGSPFAVPADFLYTVHADPKGKHLYVADNDAERIFGFSIASATGALTPLPGSPFLKGVEVETNLAVGKKLLFGADRKIGPGVQALARRQDGTLGVLGGVQDVGISNLEGIALSPNGKLLASWSGTADAVHTHAVAADGTLTPVDEKSAALTASSVPGGVFIQR